MTDELRERVRERYAAAATAVSAGDRSCCGEGQADGDTFGASRYHVLELAAVPRAAAEVSLGCGNPTAIAQLKAAERVLDLGCGGGIDVILAAQQVGPDGVVYGVDMTAEMIDLAVANAAAAGVTNVDFRPGTIEQLPLPDGVVDVVISNCVINLSTDKTAALGEIFRVLVPGGRVLLSDVVAEDRLTPGQRAERGEYVGCIAGALSRQEYLVGLSAAGFTDCSVDFTHPVADGMHGATIAAMKPGTLG